MVLMMLDDFCVFILSYDRAGDIPTLQTLEKHNYTGDWYIVIDHEDDIEPYEREYGEDKVIYFDKEDTQPDLDRGDNFNRTNSILYARYYSFQIARDLGYTYFMQLDDDYKRFEFRFGGNFEYGCRDPVEDLNRVIKHSIDFLDSAHLDTVAMSQGGDWIGGESAHIANNNGDIWAKRKAMNTLICRSDKQFDFRGSVNEDVNTYVRAQQCGRLFLTPNIVSMEQERTQQTEGGLTDLYEGQGTYIKSFYTLLYSPSSVKLSKMGEAEQRIHHQIDWRASIPKLIPEKYKKQ
jgi:hypothetical protein